MSWNCWKVMKCTIQLSRSESMNNLDWSTVEDEKDKRIRELEDTLRKQKELMEILQVFVHPTPLYSPPNILFWVFRGKCSWPRMMISQTLSLSQMRFPTSKILSTFRLNNIKGWKASKFWAICCRVMYQRLIFSISKRTISNTLRSPMRLVTAGRLYGGLEVKFGQSWNCHLRLYLCHHSIALKDVYVDPLITALLYKH